ncbi:MBL fold metallo-hydrolase [Aeromicrobium endophyticum]|uniref:MBL fold metallo-hydrolase n=1 Tax=Aeromicrobium endophyticum TaxID=2292704 RepID=A0A371PAX1_9ACTN|nr:MBL fold metallo-hydrolase [Aeromicrobium endophyticum]REK72668.1 MBL fold metallo-hydrolase [Aeromicrobium endophyticum]
MTTGGAWWGDPGCYPVARGVHRVPLSMPNDGLRAVNVYVLEGADGLVLIDGGWAVPSAMGELDAALATIGRSVDEIRDVLVTHIHQDHYTFAVRLREAVGARVRLGRGERPGLAAVREVASAVPISSLRELRRSGAADLAAEIETSTALLPFDADDWADPDEWIDPGVIDLGDRRLEAVPTPGHTKGHMVFHDVDNGLLFSGDHVLPTITPSIGFELGEWDLPLARYLTSLELLLERPDAQLVPAHGLVTPSVHERVTALLRHHHVRFGQVHEVLLREGGAPALDVAAGLRWTRRETPFSALDPFNRMIAVCETIAHLDVMAARGEVAVSDQDGVALFVP